MSPEQPNTSGFKDFLLEPPQQQIQSKQILNQFVMRKHSPGNPSGLSCLTDFNPFDKWPQYYFLVWFNLLFTGPQPRHINRKQKICCTAVSSGETDFFRYLYLFIYKWVNVSVCVSNCNIFYQNCFNVQTMLSTPTRGNKQSYEQNTELSTSQMRESKQKSLEK